MKKNINLYLIYYFLILLIFSYIFLYNKHLVANDSTISEYLINYEGGFTKRGLIGQLAIEISKFFNQKLRWTIFLLQSTICTIYFLLLFNLLKKVEYNKITILTILSPIFIFYPIAEIEVLARKEIIIFSLFLLYLSIPRQNYLNFFSLTIFSTLSVLIWEPVVFFFPIILIFEIIQNKVNKINLNLVKIIISFIPSLIICLIFITKPLSDSEHQLMALILKKDFGEACYMSCNLLLSKSTLMQQFQGNYDKYSFEVFFRYFLIIIIGFYPLYTLIKFSFFKEKNLIFSKFITNPLTLFFISLTPVILLFAMGYDWGRWVNITYVFLVIIYFKLLISDDLILNISEIKNNWISNLNNKIFFFLFIIFCFGWHPKTVISDDVGSIPGYRAPYKIFKILKTKIMSLD